MLDDHSGTDRKGKLAARRARKARGLSDETARLPNPGPLEVRRPNPQLTRGRTSRGGSQRRTSSRRAIRFLGERHPSRRSRFWRVIGCGHFECPHSLTLYHPLRISLLSGNQTNTIIPIHGPRWRHLRAVPTTGAQLSIQLEPVETQTTETKTAYAADDLVCAEPFDAIQIDLKRLWGR